MFVKKRHELLIVFTGEKESRGLSTRLLWIDAGFKARKLKNAKNDSLPGMCIVLGSAGGVRQDVRPGDIVIPLKLQRTGEPDVLLEAAEWLMATLGKQRSSNVIQGIMVTVDESAGVQKKQELALDGITAVDMEAYHVARFFQQQGSRVGVAKVITDAADENPEDVYALRLNMVRKKMQDVLAVLEEACL